MLDEGLLDWKYYTNSLSLFLKRSFGMLEHFRLYYDILKLIDDEESKIFDGLNIFNENYDLDLATDILDKIGLILNVKRKFQVVVDETSHDLNLSNDELLLLIKAQIIKNHYDGTYIQYKSLYELANIPVIIYTDNNHSATVNCFLNYDGSVEITDNIKYMFQAGYLSIESLGISYVYSITNINLFAKFDDENLTFDNCYFA